MYSTVLLRLAPLLTTTAALQFGHDMHLFNGGLLKSGVYPKSEGIIVPYFKSWFGHGTFYIFVLYPLSAATAFTNARALTAPNMGGASRFYWAGLGFVLGHFAFGPYVVGIANRLLASREGSSESSSVLLRWWLRGHAWRSVVMDFPAWLMMLSGVVTWCAAGSPI